MITTKPYTSSYCLSFTSRKTHKQKFATLHHYKYNCAGKISAAFSSFASEETQRWDANTAAATLFSNGSKNNLASWNKKEEEEEGEGEVVVGERRVKCEVEVISWRERGIRGEIAVNADAESVWSAITDYERLADFIPNLVSSGRIPCPHPGRIWLEQRGLQRALYWHIEARVVLDLQELVYSENHRELHFLMVDGDFKKFEGKWSVKSQKGSPVTTLDYEVNVIPRFNFPLIFLERIIRSDLPVNLHALACRSESNFEGSCDKSPLKTSCLGNEATEVAIVLKNKETSADIKENFVKAASDPEIDSITSQ